VEGEGKYSNGFAIIMGAVKTRVVFSLQKDQVMVEEREVKDLVHYIKESDP
jgi:hypothetical protein